MIKIILKFASISISVFGLVYCYKFIKFRKDDSLYLKSKESFYLKYINFQNNFIALFSILLLIELILGSL